MNQPGRFTFRGRIDGELTVRQIKPLLHLTGGI